MLQLRASVVSCASTLTSMPSTLLLSFFCTATHTLMTGDYIPSFSCTSTPCFMLSLHCYDSSYTSTNRGMSIYDIYIYVRMYYFPTLNNIIGIVPSASVGSALAPFFSQVNNLDRCTLHTTLMLSLQTYPLTSSILHVDVVCARGKKPGSAPLGAQRMTRTTH